MIGKLILYLFIGTPQERCEWLLKFHNFKERHIIADDPYDEMTQQYRKEKDEKRNE